VVEGRPLELGPEPALPEQLPDPVGTGQVGLQDHQCLGHRPRAECEPDDLGDTYGTDPILSPLATRHTATVDPGRVRIVTSGG
jgi:hypothetical protein